MLDADFEVSATMLDDSRLGKQRLEAKQILDAIHSIQSGNPKKGWINHPCTKMWSDYVPALKFYANCIIKEWIKRGKQNNMQIYKEDSKVVFPWWTSWRRLHHSHRAMLLRKAPLWYTGKFEVDSDHMKFGYIWPSKITEAMKDDPLETITAPIPENLKPGIVRFCTAILVSGKSKGQECGRLLKESKKEISMYCGVHKNKKI